MLTKKLLPAAVAATLLAGATTSQADDFEISANVTLTSDYRFRGISQSDESIAIQGGFDAEFGAGFYIGTWGSTVDFDTNGEGYDGSLELDYYAGWASDLGDSGLGIDVGFLYYDYPGDDDEEGDYWEVYGSMSWNDLAVGVHYSDDYYAETGEFWYVYADYCRGEIRTFNPATGEDVNWAGELGVPGRITSFGLDGSGEIYVTVIDGAVLRLERG